MTLPRDFSLSTIMGCGLVLGTCLAWWEGRLSLADAVPLLGMGATWAGMPQRQNVPTVPTQAGPAVPVAETAQK